MGGVVSYSKKMKIDSNSSNGDRHTDSSDGGSSSIVKQINGNLMVCDCVDKKLSKFELLKRSLSFEKCLSSSVALFFRFICGFLDKFKHNFVSKLTKVNQEQTVTLR